MRYICFLAAVLLVSTGAFAQPTTLDIDGDTTGDPTAFLPGFGSAPLPGICGPGPVAEPYDAYALTAAGPFTVHVIEPVDPGEPDTAPPSGSLEGLVDDTILLLYEGSFDPANACDGFIALVDESHPFDEPLTTTLDPLASYVLVVAGFMGSEDDYSIRLTAEQGGDIHVDPVPPLSECRPPNLPFWDGNLTITGGTAPTASIDLSTPNGFHSLRVLPGSENIGLLDITGLTPLLTTGSLASSIHASLFESIEYAGVTPPTAVSAVFGPREPAGSRFLFRVRDQAGCELQVDPQIDFSLPDRITLEENYPNPFNPSTRISFQLPTSSHARLDVYDVTGRRIKALLSGEFEAGTHEAVWNGTDDAGRVVASGVYFYRLEADGLAFTRQMILMK